MRQTFYAAWMPIRRTGIGWDRTGWRTKAAQGSRADYDSVRDEHADPAGWLWQQQTHDGSGHNQGNFYSHGYRYVRQRIALGELQLDRAVNLREKDRAQELKAPAPLNIRPTRKLR